MPTFKSPNSTPSQVTAQLDVTKTDVKAIQALWT